MSSSTQWMVVILLFAATVLIHALLTLALTRAEERRRSRWVESGAALEREDEHDPLPDVVAEPTGSADGDVDLAATPTDEVGRSQLSAAGG